ncbi:MAG: hypothetical protein OHK0039_44230 [Bacteroidia bacterium]
MKHLLLFVSILLLSAVAARGQQAVRPVTRALHDYDWYVAQARYWQQVCAREPQRADAWQYYYEANWAAGIVQPGGRPTDPAEIMAAMGRAVPGSFEYQYLMYRSGDSDLSRYPYLERASALAPGRSELYPEFVVYYVYAGNDAGRQRANEAWYRSGEMPEDLLAFGYNLLQSVAPDAVVLTNGDNDTYPLWLVQDALGVQTGVRVLNRYMARKPDYLSRWLREAGYAPLTADPAQPDFEARLVQHLVAGRRPLYFSLTLAADFTEPYRDKLYLTGLASRYSAPRFDNIAVLRRNIEQHFLLDHLRVALRPVPEAELRVLLRQNYLTPLLTLHRSYRQAGETARATALAALIRTLARAHGQEAEIARLLEE